MEDYNLIGTTKTPKVNLNVSKGLVELSGRSIPEVASEFYAPILDWMVEYSKNPKSQTAVQVKFEYFNTSSSKAILDIFKKLELLHKSEKSLVSVKWFYEVDDEAMQEAGEEYKILLGLPFEVMVG